MAIRLLLLVTSCLALLLLGCDRYYRPYLESTNLQEKRGAIKVRQLWALLEKTSRRNPVLRLKIEDRQIVEITYQPCTRDDLVQYHQVYSLAAESRDWFGVVTVVLPLVMLAPHLAGERICYPRQLDPTRAQIGYWENLLAWTDWFNPCRNVCGPQTPVVRTCLHKGTPVPTGKTRKQRQVLARQVVAHLPVEIRLGGRCLRGQTDSTGSLRLSLSAYRGEKDQRISCCIFCPTRSTEPLPLAINGQAAGLAVTLEQLYTGKHGVQK